jgi:ubiquinone/menaquinone biosynthesis C-methylase UbiE
MKRVRRHGSIGYRVELLVIRLRDLLRSPTKVLLDAGLGPGKTVLDFGCGPGGFSLAAARIVGPAGRVYAVDVQPLALKAVRKACARRGIDNIEALDGDAEAGVPDASVDVALAFDVLHADPEPASVRTVLSSLRRVLKTDGVLFVRDHHLREEALVDLVTADGLFSSAGGRNGTHVFAPKSDREEAA